MTRSTSVLSDYLFPILLMGCGLLGLVIINLLAQQERAQAKEQARRRSRVASPVTPSKAARPAPVAPRRAAPVARTVPRPVARPIARRAALPQRHRLVFGSRHKTADQGELERLSGFWKKAPRDGIRVSVQGWGKGRMKRRRARARARWVVQQLVGLGVPSAHIDAPVVSAGPVPAGAGEHTIQVVIRKR
jgi:hypothetical protein